MLRVCLCLGILGTVVGCSGSGDSITLPDTVPVAGVVTLDGTPISSALVTFIPRGKTEGIECIGITDTSGEFELKQIRGTDGAPAGEYTVVVNRFVKPDGTSVPMDGSVMPADVGAVESLPAHYSNFGESQLLAKVTADGGTFKFDLKSR